MRNKSALISLLKRFAFVAIIGATFAIFFWYIKTNPKTLDAVLSLDLGTLLLLTIAYSFFTIINGFVLFYSLRLLDYRVPFFENILLTGYSSIVNFFGPLQSGPGFRAVYLKKKFNVKLRDFLVTTVIFYAFFAIINGLILAVAAYIRYPNPLLIGVFVLLVIGLLITLPYLIKRSKKVRQLVEKININDRNFWMIGFGALLLTCITALTYFIELNHVNQTISLLQSAVYAATANLSLFVSLTPGAIGIREAFLLLSQQLHGISTANIVAASVIDRAFYVLFLLAMFVVLLLAGSKRRFASASNRKV